MINNFIMDCCIIGFMEHLIKVKELDPEDITKIFESLEFHTLKALHNRENNPEG